MTRSLGTMLTLGLVAAAVAETTVTFDDYPLAPESYYNGSDYAGGFTSGGVFFPNEYTDWGGGWYSWNGYSVSNMTDTTTPGYTNQYSAWTGSGYQSANYGVAYGASDLDLPVPTTVSGVYLTNTTYAALSMRDGDWFNDAFGGPDGTEPDWFTVTITGRDPNGAPTGAVVFYLADYRFENSADDYILDEWTWVDLSPLGTVATLSLSFDASNFDPYGITVPTYVALDNLVITTIPEPAGLFLLMAGTLLIGRRR